MSDFAKPSIGRTVYCIYERFESYSILVRKAYAIGKHSFITDDFGTDTVVSSWEYYYEDYGKTWAFSYMEIREALEKLILEEHPGAKIDVQRRVIDGRVDYEVNFAE